MGFAIQPFFQFESSKHSGIAVSGSWQHSGWQEIPCNAQDHMRDSRRGKRLGDRAILHGGYFDVDAVKENKPQ